jgi:hypothetical protein
MPNGYTEAALDYAMATLAEAAAPWRLPEDVRTRTRSELTSDFGQLVTDADSWKRWHEIVRRQGRTVGALAAFLADVEGGKGKVLPPAGELRLVHVAAAVNLAKAACQSQPPDAPPALKGRLCRGAFLAYTSEEGLEGEKLFAEVLKPVTG